MKNCQNYLKRLKTLCLEEYVSHSNICKWFKISQYVLRKILKQSEMEKKVFLKIRL